MTPDYDDANVRRKATARAAKMMFLFNKKDFAAIMKAVDPDFDEGKFNGACNAAGLDSTEREWLKAYLKNCSSNLYEAIPEAAESGW